MEWGRGAPAQRTYLDAHRDGILLGLALFVKRNLGLDRGRGLSGVLGVVLDIVLLAVVFGLFGGGVGLAGLRNRLALLLVREVLNLGLEGAQGCHVGYDMSVLGLDRSVELAVSALLMRELAGSRDWTPCCAPHAKGGWYEGEGVGRWQIGVTEPAL